MNGKDIRDYRFSEVFALLRQEGREVKLTVERNRERLDKTLTLRKLI